MFISVVFIHFLACFTPGPAILYALNVLSENNLKYATKVVFGIACGNAIYITLSIFGLNILQTSNINIIFCLICSVILFYFGIMGLIACFREKIAVNKFKNDNKFAINGFLITIFNPKVVIFYPVILASVVTQYSLIAKIAIALYFIFATFILLFIITYFANNFKQKTIKYMKYCQITFSTAIIMFAMLMFGRGLRFF